MDIYKNLLNNLIFEKSKLKSPIENGGLFDIYINEKEKIIYKKFMKKMIIIDIDIYKKIIYNIKNELILSKYIFEPDKIYIEDDGSYYSSYIINGINLYDIGKNIIKDNILLKIKISLEDLKINLNNYVNTKKLSGDWGIHNLIFCLDTNKIYNIDLEGFYTYPLLYDNGNCDIKYCNERFDNVLDFINEELLKSKFLEKSFISFTTNDNYLKLSEIMIKSLNIFSKYPIILYCVNFDKPIFHNKYSNLICKRIDYDGKDEIFILKPKIIYDAIKNIGIKNGVYIESDDIVTPYIDNIFKECLRIKNYPLCPIHPRDPNNQDNIMKIFNISKKTMPYVHAHVIFTENTYNFIKEWIDICKKYIKIAHCSDETILNVLFWKNNVTEYIEYIYDPFYNRIYDNKYEEKYGKKFEDLKKNIYMYHGNKDYNKAIDILENIIIKYNNDSYYNDSCDNEYFSLIIWNPILLYLDDILKDIPNILDKKEYIISKEKLHDEIFDIYKLDKRCSHNLVLPPKIEKLKEYDDNHIIVKFKIDNPEYINNISNKSIKIKEEIRKKYKSNIKNYIRDIIIHVADNFEQSKYIWEKTLNINNITNNYDSNNYLINDINNIITHKDCYNYLLNILNINNIKFVIIRGFKYLPLKPDTDLDIIIHPNSYNKFIEIYTKLEKNNLISKDNSIEYIYNNKKMYYTPLFTAKHLKDNNHLPGNYYRFDIYSDVFFYKDGECSNNNSIVCNNLFKKYLFDNLIKINNYYIPNPISEVILLIYRNIYDKRGNWSKKHIDRINELINNIEEKDFNKISNYLWKSPNHILKYLKNNDFNNIIKPDVKLNLFIIRKNGMKKEIIENIINKIENDYQILDKILININNNKKFYKKFYENYDKYKEDIEKINDNQCLAIITNNINENNSRKIKEKIRKEYINIFPPIGNIIHSSDDNISCENELKMLFDENIGNLNNIGTYYSQYNI